jgi:hypothetical protein
VTGRSTTWGTASVLRAFHPRNLRRQKMFFPCSWYSSRVTATEAKAGLRAKARDALYASVSGLWGTMSELMRQRAYPGQAHSDGM